MQGERFTRKMDNDKFIVTDSWLSRWKNRREKREKCVYGKNSNTDMSVNSNWSINRLQLLLNKFSPDNIYNQEENGFYYQDEYL